MQGSWRPSSLSYDAALTLSYLLSPGAPTTASTVLQPHFIMFALGVFILIHSIGIFTNIALNGTLTLFAEIPLSRLRPIQLLSESIWI